MQYKKAGVSKRIVECARAEFLQNGFNGSNIKVIAQNAGVPIGNLYRYFNGKSGLLDAVVGSVYNEIPTLIDKFARLYVSPKTSFAVSAESIAQNLVRLFDLYKTELLILAYGCDNTKYGDFSVKTARRISEILSDMLRDEPTDEQREFLYIICKNFISTAFELLKGGGDEETLVAIFDKLIIFTFYHLNDRIKEIV